MADCKCGKKLGATNKKGMCMTCQLNQSCSDCGTKVSERSTGRCRKCANTVNNATDAHRAATSAAMKTLMADPVAKEARTVEWRKWHQRQMQDPAYRERLRMVGVVYGSKNIAATRSPEVRAKAGRSISAVKLAHVPGEVRTMYRALRRKGV